MTVNISRSWITAAEALAVLQVRPQTLYASVSRGRLRARPDPQDPRRSLYHRGDVLRLAERRRGRRKLEQVAAQAIDWGEPVLPSAVSTVIDGRLWYRGQDAVRLAQTAELETVAALLWEAEAVSFDHGRGAGAQRRDARSGALSMALPALAARAAQDLPSHGRAAPVLRAEAAELVSLLVRTLAGGPGRGGYVAQRLARAWHRPRAADLIRRALVLLADHELNASTFAARVTISTGAPLAAALLAGLSTLSGPLHGGAAGAMRALVAAARTQGAGAAVREHLRQGRRLPAFGHPLYPRGDARAVALLSSFTAPPAYGELADCVEHLHGERPNVDFALAALAEACRLPAEAPLVIFAVARSVGWVAHALEQIASGQMIRPRARYTGPRPAAAP